MESSTLIRLFDNDYSLFREQVLRHLPPVVNYQKVIPPQQQQAVLDALKSNYSSDQFFFTTEIQTSRIKEKFGIAKWLGYDEEKFDLSTYIKSIHPTQVMARNLFYYHWLERLLAGDFNIEFMKQRFSTLLSMRKADGNYLYVKQTAFFFQYDNKHRLLEYLNLFTVIHDKHEDSYRIQTSDENGHRLAEWEREVNCAIKKSVLESGVFSDVQIKILQYVTAHSDMDFNLKSIAEQMAEHDEHIKTQMRRIKDKINQYFKTNFTESRLAILFLVSQGLL